MSGIETTKLDHPPERLPSDAIQLIFLLVVFVVGVPCNLLLLRRLLILHKTTRKEHSKAAFLLLKLHLTLSDLMLLIFYVAPKLAWIITYEWVAGDCLCKLYNYVSLASFYLSSNIIVCIALDKLRTVLGALRVGKRTRTTRSAVHLIVPAWILAFTFASPQLVIFQTVNILNHTNTTWMQCTDVWTISSIQHSDDLPAWFLSKPVELAYNVAHLLLAFWLPLLVLLISYGTIAVRLTQVSSAKPPSHVPSMNRLTDARGRAMSMPGAKHISTEEGSRLLNKRHSLSPAALKKKLRSFSIMSQTSERSEEVFPQGGLLWRRRIREKLFRSTLLIVIAHFLFWFPYNFSALLAQASDEYREMIALHAYFLNDLQVLITLVNPILYAITE